MLIRITNKCNFACSHCFNEQTGPEGEHMAGEVFGQTLDFARRVGARAAMLTGGEPTLHPHLLPWMDKVLEAGLLPIIVSNGSFVRRPGFTNKLIKQVEKLHTMIQVTNDDRYYSEPLPDSHVWQHPNIAVVDQIGMLRPCRRVKEKGFFTRNQYPNCFNLRSLTRSRGLTFAVQTLETRGRYCVPAVGVDGRVHVGEMDTCHRVGHVSDKVESIEDCIQSMRCATCGLARRMPPEHKRAVGEA